MNMHTKTPVLTPTPPLAPIDETYIQAATSDSTRQAYQRDIQDYLRFGATLPATAHTLEAYLRARATVHNPRTLKRRLIALRRWHVLQGHNDPTQDPLVIKTLQGIARLYGQPRKQAAALRLVDLDQLLASLAGDLSKKAVRNRALLLLGFFGALRRTELVTLTWAQVHFVSDGMILTFTRSKTDQVGEGSQCVIPFGDDRRCPVRALLHWRQVSGVWDGAVFRRLSKTESVLTPAITPQYWNQLIRQMAQAAHLPQAERICSHSLRRGFATEAARLGASMPAIQKHGRWRSTKTVIDYIEAGRQFEDSAVNVLFAF